MKEENNLMIILLIILIASFILSGNLNANIIVKKRRVFQIKKSLDIKKPYDFGVKNDRIYILDEGDEYNMKVFNMKGELIEKFGKRGGGPGELLTPVNFAVGNKYCAVYDMRTHTISVYKKEGNRFVYKKRIKISFAYYYLTFIDEETILGGGQRLLPLGTKLESYAVSLLNLRTGKERYYIPSYVLYNLKNTKEYFDYDMSELRFIGEIVYCSYCNRRYIAVSLIKPIFAWVNINDMRNVRSFYDKKLKFRGITRKEKNLIKSRRFVEFRKRIRDSLPEFDGIFCFHNKIGVIYMYQYKENGENMKEYRLRFYRFKQKKMIPVKDVMIYKNNIDNFAFNYFSFEKGHLYVFEYLTPELSEEKFQIHEFKIMEKK